jgi:predicted ester cyclase
MTGGQGLKAIRDFYTRFFIPQMPPDTKTTPVSRTIGDTQIVDEMIFEVTHTVPMDWMLPGIAPTGKRVEVALVAIIGFREGKVSHEHIYWDQASVLVQLGLLDASRLPVAGRESAAKVRDASLPSNQLIERAADALRPAVRDAPTDPLGVDVALPEALVPPDSVDVALPLCDADTVAVALVNADNDADTHTVMERDESPLDDALPDAEATAEMVTLPVAVYAVAIAAEADCAPDDATDADAGLDPTVVVDEGDAAEDGERDASPR